MNKQKLLYRKIKTHRKIIIIGLIVLLSILAISSNIIGRSFTSDDVAQQTITHNLTFGGEHNILLGNDTFVLRLPIYALFDVLTSPGRGQLILESVVFNCAMVSLLYLWWRGIARKNSSKWLIFIWLLSGGVYWVAQTINPNTRNIELPLMLLFGWWVVSRLESPPANWNRRLLCIILGSLAAGILTYNDPYFLFLVTLPLLASVLIQSLTKKKLGQPVAVLVGLIASSLLYKVLSASFNHFGIRVADINDVNGLVSSITPLGHIPLKILSVLNSYLSLLGASPSRLKSDIWALPVIALNLGVIFIAIGGLYSLIRRRKFTLLNIWILAVIIFSLSYIVLTGISAQFTARYLIILLPITGFLIAYGLQELLEGGKKYYKLALLVICLSLFANVIQDFSFVHERSKVILPNKVNYQIISALNENRINNAYGDYWVANISYYLSDYKDNILPTSCDGGKISKYPVLLDAQRFILPTSRIGVIVSPNIEVSTRGQIPIAASCNGSAITKQLGKPSSIVYVAKGVSLFIYDQTPRIAY